MLNNLYDRFASVVLWFYGKVSRIVGGFSNALNLPAASSRFARHFAKPTPLVFVELFVALALTVNFFFLVKPMSLPKRDGNMYNSFMFAYLSKNTHVPIDMVQPGWRTRLLAPTVSGWLMDTLDDRPYDPQSEDFQTVFGIYHAAWLFLLFLALIYFRKDALLIMLGVFCGLMYNYIGPTGMYYYPWDMPALFFFTLACLLYDRRIYWLLIPAICVGSLFKETTLCCALLILLDGQWTWAKRIGGFLATVIATMLISKGLVLHYHVHTASLAMGSQVNDFFRNARSLFGLEPNHVLFVNAGSLFLVMLLPWRSRRDVVLKLVMLVFMAGQFAYGIATEVRIWYEMLPLGWMLLSERISEWRLKMAEVSVTSKAAAPVKKSGAPKPAEPTSVLAGRVYQGSYWLMLISVFIVTFGVFVLAEIKGPPPSPPAQDDDVNALKAKAQSGDAAAQFKLGLSYEQDQDYNNAATWFQKAAQQGNANAENALGALFASRQDYASALPWIQRAADQGVPEGEMNLAILDLNGYGVKPDAVAGAALLEKAATQGLAQAQFFLGQLYEHGQGVKQDYVEAYKWLKVAQMQGFANADKELSNCSLSMTPDQIASAEKQANQFPLGKK
jgi:Sel1 repeat